MEDKKKLLTLYLEEELHSKIKELAESKGYTMTEFIVIHLWSLVE